MRLTTLARKIEQTPNKLIEFLENIEIELDNGINTKLDEPTIKLVFEYFAPDQIQDEAIVETEEEEDIQEFLAKPQIEDEEIEVKEVPVENDVIEEKEPKEDLPEKVELDNVSPSIKEEKIGTIDDLEGDSIEEIDLIKVKKVKLDGIKVVGKIELPEKPKKEEFKKTEGELVESQEEQKKPKESKPVNKKFNRNRKKNKRGHYQKTLSYDERIKEEEREKLKKRRRRENAEKRRKKKFYQENIEPKTIQKPKRKKKKQSLSQVESQEKVIVHKNPLKRLWAWLNGKYDRY